MNLDLESINRCVRCGTCRSVCPVFEEVGWESANTRGRILAMKGLYDGLVAGPDVLDSLNTCTTCGICTASCPAGVKPPDMVEGVRRELVSSGIMSREQALLKERLFSSGNVFGDPGDRLAWLERRGQEGDWLKGDKAKAIYFVGCLNSYRYQDTASRTFDLLRRFGATILADEQCCGSPLVRTGFDAGRLREANVRQIREIGADTIITGCAGCYSTLKRDYPPDLRVMSVPEFLADRLPELDLKPLEMTVTYHDPCHLGRQSGIYDQPRRVIESICRLKEMRASRESARCCGGGGGVRVGYRDLSLRMAKRRLADVPEGVDFIVTSCPLCIRNLRDAGAGRKVIDIVDLVAASIGDSATAD